MIGFPHRQDDPPASDQQCAGRRIGVRMFQASPQIRRQPRSDGVGQPAHQREPVNSSRQEEIEEIANGIGRAFDNAAADRIALIGVPHHDRRERSVVCGPGFFGSGHRLIGIMIECAQHLREQWGQFAATIRGPQR